MTKQEFVNASKKVASFYYGVNLPLDIDDVQESDEFKYFFMYEMPSSYVNQNDDDVDCVFWYSVAVYKEENAQDKIELSRGIDGRSGDHFFLNYKDWL
ncbi:hypothetical protein [Treponema pectinovorum]|uniref:hypothetical protein n=1 Tax=Treponema pectinovorum TaxID=164 RepID=UPI0011C8FE57|nr:hypothetical protein [Treponema pectinovorum]